jgi:hypothetical protein
MIYAIITLSILWFVSSIYFLRHIALIIKELNEIDKEQHQQNMDIIHLLKMDIEIAKALDHNAKIINQTNAVAEYLLELNDKPFVKKDSANIFNPPKGEA